MLLGSCLINKHEGQGQARYQGKRERFLLFAAAKRQLDLQGLFDSPWFDDVVGGKELGKEDGCALDGGCVCSEDRHCSPEQGYYCRTGLVFTEARVCRYSASQLEGAGAVVELLLPPHPPPDPSTPSPDREGRGSSSRRIAPAARAATLTLSRFR
ncbi:hypothetical protein ZWY2020_053610 [Hordeum vulgare]|nr:hypothetical protein ZWY2020_053610 [Hordeum vulgare]